ncbi:inorganic phosphate transporter [Antrihabitans sp. YC2-6]|uniref:inorganic phosphate transporter n=1 Tax=Antrihabitans sp. YC2-6 TaxID=2799498 RepID=UPI0018F481DA|nr:inorganic phosphate transporter [Antrihabitans sp. YC2-6]MBJ8346993.1 inorganic phosphate transporter [Antrihabitans sp. YC2-6]
MSVFTVLVIVVGLAMAFDITNGFHDSANAVAALVATRAATPAQALALASAGHILGPLLAGTAVADTVGGVVHVAPHETVTAIAAALTAAIAWNMVTWKFGLPSSSSHALVGGLVGAAIVAGGLSGVRWGGFSDGRPTGVFGVLAGLAISPVLGVAVGAGGIYIGRRLLRRARREINGVIRKAEWVTASALAFSHGANDAQKTMGVVTLLLVAEGQLSEFAVPFWVRFAAAACLTVGTALGGWRIVRTVGSGVYRMQPLDGLVSQGGSAAVILVGAAVGAPVSTTHVVASGVVGVGLQQRAHHVHWAVVREIGAAWIVTLPISAAVAVFVYPLWSAVT